jgi:serine/threonine protein kinase
VISVLTYSRISLQIISSSSALMQTETGSPIYSAPEIMDIQGDGYKKSVDVYSVCLIFYEVFSDGTSPFPINHRGTLTEFIQTKLNPYQPPYSDNIPKMLWTLVIRGYDLDESRRPKLSELKTCLESLSRSDTLLYPGI